MDDQDPRPGAYRPAYEELPPRVVSANQLVAYNIAYWRQAKGMTQDELGTLLENYTGRSWSKATVSAAERSWDGKRIRQFDADELIALCEALQVPLPALLTPPSDDGIKFRYGIVTSPGTGGDEGLPMRDLLGYLIHDAGDDEDGNLGEFRRRFVSAVDFHYGEGTFGSLSRFTAGDEKTKEEQLNQRMDELRWQREALRIIMGDIERESASIAEVLEEGNVGHHDEEPNQQLEELRAKMREAIAAREDAVMLIELSHLGFSVPDEFERHESRVLLHELLNLARTSNRQSATPGLMHDLAAMLDEAIEKASDYRTPWFKLQTYCRKTLEGGMEKDLALRVAEALNDPGNDPESVLEKFGLEKVRANTMLRMNGIKVPASLKALMPPIWPKASV